jgi:hypothetical protein
VFLYRLTLVGLSLSFLCALGGAFTLRCKRDQLVWLFPLSTIPLLLPAFLGRPAAAEVYLVPLAGFAMIALYTGTQSKAPLWTSIGLTLGALVTCLKAEGWIVLVFVVLPWYLAGWVSRGHTTPAELAREASALAAGLIPWIAWRVGAVGVATTSGRGIHFELDDIGLSRLLDSGPLLAGIGETAVKLLLKNHYWVAFFLVLPAAVASNLVLQRGAWSLLVPLGVVSYSLGMTLCSSSRSGGIPSGTWPRRMNVC